LHEDDISITSEATRARSKIASREKIIQAAKEMFSAQGFEESSLRDIAAHAGLTTGAVFANFADKLDLFHTVFEAEMNRVFAQVYAAFDDGLDTLACMLKKLHVGYGAVVGQQRLFMSAFVLNWTQHFQTDNRFVSTGFRIREVGAFVLRRGIERGEIPADADVRTAAVVIEELMLAALRVAYYQQLTPDAVIAYIGPQLQIVVNGLKFKA
jgi:AcrR family transcriptional regulator